ncbi:MAG TPA: tetratricopeptide repeat protein, partial [Pirellulales bacterium]
MGVPAAQGQFNLPLISGIPPTRFELSDSVHVDEADSATRTHLERVRAFLANRQWDEAVETLRQVMEEHGEKLVAVELRPAMAAYLHTRELRYELKHYLSLRELCQMLISELPADALKLYRDRVDPAARRLYDEAASSAGEAALRRVVEQFFVSSYGDQALLRLGDLALERGDEAQARAFWQQLIPAAGWQQAFAVRPDRRPPWLVYPDTDIEPADIAARLVLLSIFENAQQARSELEQFRTKYPAAQGRLAGRDANYAQTLTAMAEAASGWSAPLPPPGWPTFAGSPERTLPVNSRIDVGAVRWHRELPKAPAVDLSFSTRRVAEDHHEPLSYYPLVVGELLLLNNQYEIRAYNIRTGEAAWGRDPVIYRDEEFSAERRPNRSTLGVPRFTMTAFGGKLFARMGNPASGSQNEQLVPSAQGYLVCLDLAAEGKLLWR